MDERTAVQVLIDLRRECSEPEWDAVTAAIAALGVLGRRREAASPVVINSLRDLVVAAADRGFSADSSPAGLFVELDRLRAIEQDLIAIRDGRPLP